MAVKSRTDDTDPLSYLLHGPDDLAAMHVEHARRIKANPGITLGVPSVDRFMIPGRPGDMIAICGRPGAGKSSLSAMWARKVAKEIEKEEDKCVVYVTWEQTAEELMAFFAAGDRYTVSDYAWGRVEMDDVLRNAVASTKYPVFVIGHSLRHAGKATPRLTIETLGMIVDKLWHERGRKPVMMILDYLQLIPSERQFVSKTERINHVAPLIKQLGISYGFPTVPLVQASREVDHLKPPIPKMQHAQWASIIEQTADKFLSVMRPWLVYDHNKTITPPGYDRSFVNSPDLLILDMSKQRMEDGAHTWALHFTPQSLKLSEYETDAEEHPMNH